MESDLIFVPDAWDFYSFELSDLQNATDDEFNAMVELNRATDCWLGSKIDTAEYTDVLSWHDVNPDKHLQDTDWYLEQMLANG